MVKKVRIKFFATLRHLTGRQEVEIELPDDATVQDLKDALILKFPEIKDADNKNTQYNKITKIIPKIGIIMETKRVGINNRYITPNIPTKPPPKK